jgi:dinuclear metal center YbgI/SA1388 family protein
MANVADVVRAIEARWDPRWAEPWDAVGLVCGDPDAPVRRLHLAVDPVEAVIEEAVAHGADLLLTHHPLFLGGTESVAATTAKGRIVHRLVTSGTALYVAHTNADVACPGVSDALAATVGLRSVRPLLPALERGMGRVGELEAAVPLREFVASLAAQLPATRWGVRASGDPGRSVRVVAVAGGSCGELVGAAAEAGADVFVTSDLKHHRAAEAVADHDIALVDAAHWATEQPWVLAARDLLAADLRERGITVDVTASRIVTDPWTLHAHQPEDQ